MAAIGVAGWFVQPIVEKIIDAGFDYLSDQVGGETHVKDEYLGRLQANLSNIQAVVDFASSQTEISNQHLIKWLWKLRDVVDEADDVLDDFKYMNHEQQLTKNNKNKIVSSSSSFTMEELVKRLEEVVKKLDNLSTDVGTFLHLLDKTKQEQKEKLLEFYKTRETGSLPADDHIIGRDNDKDIVMQWLMSKPSNEEEHQTTSYKNNISLLSIVGHGGMGKTTLLQHVYEDEKTTKEFPLKMWVCVSTNFDAKKVIADMLEYLTDGRPVVESLGKLQQSLKSKVNSNKFLLVLDDIWEEEKEEQNKRKWENVLAPLVSGSLGSKILITTRTDSVASMIAKVMNKKSEIFKVEGLEEKECLQLLKIHAFADEDNHPNVDKLGLIAEKIVKKLSGSPLLAKIMGGVLNSSLNERHWENVLYSDIISLEAIQNDSLPILRLSYTFLPKHLQSCFAFCCIFQQDHQFYKDDLVRMWIALGFIQPSDIRGRETLEDIGGRYFDALVKKSFFDKFIGFYKMHDLLHDLARSVSKHECLRVEMDQELFFEFPETIRHLSLETRNREELKKIGQFKNLRSLFLIYNEDNKNVDVITEILNATRSIRLLCIDLEMIPQAIGYLTHLRYLEVGYSNNTLEWPTSLCNLYHLQFIILQDFINQHYSTFPENTNNLSNLRYLEILKLMFCSIPEIGKLTSLQALDEFKIQNKSGYRIGELEKMNDLRKLSINYLDNVEDAQEACNAKLSDKKNLTNLSLQWEVHMNCIDLDEKVLDNLQPPSCLHKLVIDGYMGGRSAKWMNKADFISNLKILELIDCSNWQTLPPFGQLRFLKSLSLFSMCKVERFDNKFDGNDEHCVFPSLEMLNIYNFEALKDLFDSEVVAAAADHRMFPCLTELYLHKCPKLQELPYLPPKLKKLLIREIGWKTLNCCGISKYSTLEELIVWDCPNITNISLTGPAALRYLEIRDCPKLISLGGHQEGETTKNCQLILDCLTINDPSILLIESLRSIASIQKLNIERNDDEHCVFPSLEVLNIYNSEALQDLFDSEVVAAAADHCMFPCLTELHLENCPKLQELPYLPPKLKKLFIYKIGCKTLNCCGISKYSTLEELSVRSCPNITSISLTGPAALSGISKYSTLKKLSVWSCPNITNISLTEPAALRYLEIIDCPKLISLGGHQEVETTKNCQLIIDRLTINDPSILLIEPLRSIASIQQLNIERNDELVLFPIETEQWFMQASSSLCELNFKHLKSLQSLPSFLESLSSLKTLRVHSVPQLRELPNLPPSLAELHLRCLDNLDCLPSCLSNLSSLKYLYINDVPRLRDLPDLSASSLEGLYINGCLPELQERYRRDEGSDWHKIAHIPDVNIST